MGAWMMEDILRSFSGKRVLVTGHTGFKGSWLTFLLTEVGADVLGYALAPDPERSHFEMLRLTDKIIHIVADIRDSTTLADAMQSFQPEYVFHLAAQALVRQSYVEPLATITTNVIGSANVLDAVRNCSAVRSLVYITSDKCYENVEWVWGYRENDRLGGHDPYSASKAAAELVFAAYARSYFSSRSSLGAATARAGNVIGGGDWAKDRIVPDCVRAAEMKRPIVLRNPSATRPWQHVLEPVSGYLLLASRLRNEPERHAGSWNFGPSTANVRTVADVANAISERFNNNPVETVQSRNHHHEARLLQLNCDKAHQMLGWYPRWSVDKTIAATAEWYKSVLDGRQVEEVTRAQLHDYFPELA